MRTCDECIFYKWNSPFNATCKQDGHSIRDLNADDCKFFKDA